jgi:hypothetical protein
LANLCKGYANLDLGAIIIAHYSEQTAIECPIFSMPKVICFNFSAIRKKDDKFRPAALDSGYTRKYISHASNKVMQGDL